MRVFYGMLKKTGKWSAGVTVKYMSRHYEGNRIAGLRNSHGVEHVGQKIVNLIINEFENVWSSHAISGATACNRSGHFPDPRNPGDHLSTTLGTACGVRMRDQWWRRRWLLNLGGKHSRAGFHWRDRSYYCRLLQWREWLFEEEENVQKA